MRWWTLGEVVEVGQDCGRWAKLWILGDVVDFG